MKLDLELATPRLILRPFKNADLDHFLEAIEETTEDLKPWVEWCDEKFSQEIANKWIKDSQHCWENDFSYEMAIIHRYNNEFIGTVSLTSILPNFNSANLGYWVRSRYQHQGIAKEASIEIANFGFQMLGLTRLEIITHPDNIASQKTAKSCNAVFECEARNRIYLRNKACSGFVFSLTPFDLI